MPRRENPLAAAGRYTGLAFILPVSTLVGYGIGYLLDRAFGTSFLYIVFLLLGIVSGFISFFRQLNRQFKRDEQ